MLCYSSVFSVFSLGRSRARAGARAKVSNVLVTFPASMSVLGLDLGVELGLELGLGLGLELGLDLELELGPGVGFWAQGLNFGVLGFIIGFPGLSFGIQNGCRVFKGKPK